MILGLVVAADVMNAAPVAHPCAGSDTISMAKCMDAKIATATQRLNEYVGRAESHFQDDRSTNVAIADSLVAFEAYKKIYCGAVYEQWRGGTIRYAMAQSCELKLIDEQTHRVWEDFLIPFQQAPILPEPEPTR